MSNQISTPGPAPLDSSPGVTDEPITYDAVDDFVDLVSVGPDDFVDTAYDPNPPVNDPTAPSAYYGALPQSAAAQPRPVLLGAASALDQLVPVVYGRNKVRGLLYAHKDTTTSVYQVYVFCHGEQAGLSASDITIGNKTLSEWNTAGFVTAYHIRLGASSETQSSILGVIMSGTDVPTTKLPGYCYLAIQFDRDYPGPFPSTLQPVAIVDGRKVTDFRDSTVSASTNPMVIANDIMTDRGTWPGFNDLPDGTPRWSAADYDWIADRCDELMSDSTTRFEYSGILTQRSAEEALKEVLGHCFCDWYLLGSTVKIVSDLLPEQVPGVWSATASATLTGSTGSATGYGPNSDADSSGVAVNSRLLLVAGTIVTVLAVDSVSTPNTITIDQNVTIANEVVRKISDCDIHAVPGYEGWISGPDEEDIDPASAPDAVKVIYTNNETFDRATYRAEDPDGYTADDVVRTEVTFEGVRHASVAARVGHQLRRSPKLAPFSWTGVAGPEAAGVEPGDIITFDSSTLSDQLARVTSVSARLDNTYELAVREFDVSVYSDDVADDDTPVSGISTVGPPDLPTGVTQKFIFRGDLDSYNELADPDDLTATGANFTAADSTLTYHATGDYTEWAMSGTPRSMALTSPSITWASYGSVPEYSILVFLFRLDAATPGPFLSSITLNAEYWAGTAGSEVLKESTLISAESLTTNWQLLLFYVHNNASDNSHYISFQQQTDSGGPSINFKRMFWLPATQIPFMGIRQLFSFTEASGASDTVLKYLATFSDAEGNTIDGPSVPQGNDNLSVPIIVAGEPPEGPSVRLGYDLFAVGGWGRKQATISTQVIQDVNMGAVIDSHKNVDGSGKASGNLAVIGSDGDTMEFQTLAAAGVKGSGHTSSTADPTTTEYPSNGDWGIHKNTTTSKIYAVFNDGGTIKKVELA